MKQIFKKKQEINVEEQENKKQNSDSGCNRCFCGSL